MWDLVTFIMRAGSVLGLVAFGAVVLAFAMHPVVNSDTTEGR